MSVYFFLGICGVDESLHRKNVHKRFKRQQMQAAKMIKPRSLLLGRTSYNWNYSKSAFMDFFVEIEAVVNHQSSATEKNRASLLGRQ